MNCKTLLKLSLLSGVFFTAARANAQMVGSDIFLKGKYVEVGIGALGYYGSDSSAPAGYNPHCAGCSVTNGIGFVADPAMTSWTTYNGDYFLPGSPFEGWELQVNGHRVRGINGFPSGAVGANTSYTTSGSSVIGIWQGTFDSVAITQTTSLDTNSLYFTTNVTVTNLATTPQNDLYYFRSVDPDNDETWLGGSFVTSNLIEHQNPDSVLTSVVSASSTGSRVQYMAMGTTDSASRAIIYSSWPMDSTVDLATVYNETYSGGSTYYGEAIPHVSDIAIGLTMYIPHLATVDSAADSVMRTTSTVARHPANSATFHYFTAFSADAVDSAIAAANTPGTVPSLNIKNINTVADVKVYPNPSKDIINVSGLTVGYHISLYDKVGRNMQQNWNVGSQKINTFSYSNVPSGAYLLIVSDANGNVKARVSVRKM